MFKLYNTLSRSIETFKPRKDNEVTMYSCGPTVYDYQHIGHMRRYVGDDILVRILRLHEYKVTRVMNITDVGHLVSDADEGEDKMEKGARKFGLSVWEIAKMFEKQFIESCEALLIEKPTSLLHATDYIREQIALINVLRTKGFTYNTIDGIYFDTSKFRNYFELSRQNADAIQAGARVEMIDEKKNASDFALWKFEDFGGDLNTFPKRQMNWWFEGENKGKLVTRENWQGANDDEKSTLGFPGWHIECSAMSEEGLFHCFHKGALDTSQVQTIDIHTGGIDHIAIHHTNEIAQSEAATGKQFVKYWVHHNFLQVNGEKMSKSLGNFYTVQDVVDKGYDPLALRYLYLQTHYRQEMNFTWESLDAAQTALSRLRREVLSIKSSVIASEAKYRLVPGEAKHSREETTGLPRRKAPRNDVMDKFTNALSDDMNTAKALAIVWELLKSDYPPDEKIGTLVFMDNTLGIEMFKDESASIKDQEIPQDIKKLITQREEARKQRNFAKSDLLRKQITDLGYDIKDTPHGPEITPFKK